ncbi:dihydrodipicolinate synthase family protein [Oscillochloris sp. ZM17-4]|uniref:dihydrodipicolinate synthase family protein n=1 Tax=Oscillochloris sp. ZM17-4 TaxID=2866714 RepID=UPI001C73A990|nr:dihydrodipicolinate synthase family protein [Oscillochloris sp. ZM17-4]MBX0328585.1 dihydrodipicolinate synthase family protein [Oscillochloris sp. ZM17-4]
MTRFPYMRGVFGLLPTPYREDYEIHTPDLRAAADFCCRSGQHGIVWPVMVGEFYFMGEEERIRNLDAVLEEVNGRLPLIFGCSGVSIQQVLLFARAARRAGADAVIAMAPARASQAMAIEMFHRLADAFQGPIVLQNAAQYAPLTGEQIARLVEDVPQIEYIKEERPPGPRHIAEVRALVGDKVKTIFGGAAGKFLPDELRRGADGCMPACEVADLLALVMERWWAGDQAGARDLHRRLLPLINLETYPFMRYILKRRGVFSTLVERAPVAAEALDEDDRREISTLLEAVAGDVRHFPFGPE